MAIPAIACVVGRKDEFRPRPDDIFQERLYAIQWITKKSINASRQITYFSTVTEADLAREQKVEKLVANNLAQWQAEGSHRIWPLSQTTTRISQYANAAGRIGTTFLMPVKS